MPAHVRVRHGDTDTICSVADLPYGQFHVRDGIAHLDTVDTAPPPNTPNPEPVLTRSKEPAMPPAIDVDDLLETLTRSKPTGTASRSWPTLHRAAAHIVHEIDSTNAATPNSVFPADGTAWSSTVAALVAARPSLLSLLPLVNEHTGTGTPAVPSFAFPTAGPQGGQKNELTSDAFTVAAATTAAMIDSSLYLNVSLQLETALPGAVEAIIAIAVGYEAEAQIIGAAEAVASSADTAAGLAAITGPWSPTLAIVPPAGLLDDDVYRLAQSGAFNVVAHPAATKITLMDPAGIVGWLAPLRAIANEPSVVGRQVARALWGQVQVQSGAVATVDMP